MAASPAELPLVTVGIPVRDGAETLRFALESVRQQTFRRWVAIVVDDGSSDTSSAIAGEFAALDPRFCVLSDGANRGLVARLNQLASLATTPYLARMDADDVMHPDRLARQIAHLESAPGVEVLATGAWTIDEAGRVYATRHLRPLDGQREGVLSNDYLLHPTVTGRTAWFRANPYDPTFVRGEDKELWCRAWRPGAFARLPEPLLWYRAGHDVRIPTYRTGSRTDRRILVRYAPPLVGWRRTGVRLALSWVREMITVVGARAGVGRWIIGMRSAPLHGPERRYGQRVHDEVVHGRPHVPMDDPVRPLRTRLSDGARYLAPLAVDRFPGRRTHRSRAADRAIDGIDRPALPLALLVVYRQRNAATVESLVRSAGPGADVRLWALDEAAPSLADRTVGVGPGAKFDLLDRLLEHRALADDAYVVVGDDDVVLQGHDLPSLVEIGGGEGYDLFQPAHGWSSIFSHAFLLARPWLVARRTTFVEIGPLFVVGPRHRSSFLPFPAGTGMGWGLEVAWYRRHRQGCRLGVIDGCRMVHLGPVGSGYDTKQQAQSNRRLLDQVGARSVYELMRTEERRRRRPAG